MQDGDIGSWDQLWDYSTKDKFGNTKQGNIVLENSKIAYLEAREINGRYKS